jgi:hypothetical protein
MGKFIVNPHPVPDPGRLARVHDETLARLIVIHVADLAPEPRRQLAGIPPLVTLEAERRRRECSRLEAAS